ncbi:MAG TPA: SLC13 family permease [Verrucomicrobiota bacterium]|nr:SLC13 family permease [Verrucomicrobiota bacterium]HRZ36199.1 SLC13 family permease [Candidatus Paceibacterota bacterium]
MTQDQVEILVILSATVGLFLWGRWRHDMVAMAALLACVFAGLVPRGDAFAGFGHPAVITVACVLVLSRGLQISGAVDAVTRRLLPAKAGPTVTIGALTGLGALLSAFMNNVGALALLMPVAIQIAAKQKLTPGRVLMPLAFGSILGGMTTLIGTPPNLIVSGFRASTGSGSFAMFDFTPVGLAVAAAGLVFVALVGWRLVPARERAGAEGFEIGAYLTEVRVPEESKAVGKTLRGIGGELAKADAQVVGMVRNEFRVSAPSPGRVLRANDILVIEAEPESLSTLLSSLGLKLVEDVKVAAAKNESAEKATDTAPDSGGRGATQAQEKNPDTKAADGGDIGLMELAVRPESDLISRSATDLQLRTRFGINLLALSRQGQRSLRRLRSERFRAGDVLLMQGPPSAVISFANEYGCVPLAERELRIPNQRQAVTAAVIMAAAVAGAAFGLMPAAIAFAAGALALLLFRVVPPRTVYGAVDWPVIVLLAALMPVAGAMASTGAADSLARLLLQNVAQGNAILALTLILVVTMTLSDFMNNAATAAVMCPIAIGTATQLEARPDSFLMAVALGASCAFLTPIGHQNNTLILGPSGFRFGDYWRLGLPLEILVIAISIPMLLLVWPL